MSRAAESDMTKSLTTVSDLLRCPATGESLQLEEGQLVSASGRNRYTTSTSGIPLFAQEFCSAEGRVQQRHYDRVAASYLENLTYPHTQEYNHYLDEVLLNAVKDATFDNVAEICCGRGEAFQILGTRIGHGVGIDVSLAMLEAARRGFDSAKFTLFRVMRRCYHWQMTASIVFLCWGEFTTSLTD